MGREKMSVERGLIGFEDLKLGTGTFERTGRTGTPVTLTKISDIIDPENGPFVDARFFATLAQANTQAVAIGAELLILDNFTGTSAVTFTAPVRVMGKGKF